MLTQAVYRERCSAVKRSTAPHGVNDSTRYQEQVAERDTKERDRDHYNFLVRNRIAGGIDFLGGVFA